MCDITIYNTLSIDLVFGKLNSIHSTITVCDCISNYLSNLFADIEFSFEVSTSLLRDEDLRQRWSSHNYRSSIRH